MENIAEDLEELAPPIEQPFDDDELDVGLADDDIDDIEGLGEDLLSDNHGGHVLGACRACKTNTMQAVIDRAGDTVIRSQCAVCGSEHAFRAPTREKARSRSKGTKKKAAPNPAKLWSQKSEQYDGEATPYSIAGAYELGAAISHPRFGLGFVVELCSSTKMDVVFESEVKRLVFNLED